jgi:7-cyano-7-deazaguanine reductase
MAGKKSPSARRAYTARHAVSGIRVKRPSIECWENQFKNYVIAIEAMEYSSICPKTGLPDFGSIFIRYQPRARCLELKSLKMYLLSYRNLGIFYENAVNCILRDVVAACKPRWAHVRGEFSNRGGIRTSVEAAFGPVPGVPR